MKHTTLKSITSLFIDLVFTFFFYVICFNFFDINLKLLAVLIIGFLSPLAAFPITFVSYLLFKTTPGLALTFQTYENEQPKLKVFTSLYVAFHRSLEAFFLLVPGINIIYLYLLLKKKRFLIPYKHVSSWKRPVFSLIALISALFMGELPNNNSLFVNDYDAPSEEMVSQYLEKEWHKVSSKPPGNCSALFPQKPKHSTRDFPIPGGKKSLSLFEYCCKHPKQKTISFTLSHTQLPKSWVKWGSGLVLKHALKYVSMYLLESPKIATKQLTRQSNYKALNYQLQKGGTHYQGKLILIKDTLYRLEASYTKKPSNEQKFEIQGFLNSIDFK